VIFWSNSTEDLKNATTDTITLSMVDYRTAMAKSQLDKLVDQNETTNIAPSKIYNFDHQLSDLQKIHRAFNK
jgi:hypothetical protein